MLAEDPGLRADVGWDEREGLAARIAHAHRARVHLELVPPSATYHRRHGKTHQNSAPSRR